MLVHSIIAFKVIFVIFLFGFCIFIHEFGHLLAALWRGLHIEKFSIGFGNAIIKRRWFGVDFQIAWLPFGGFVALPQLDPTGECQTIDGVPLPPVSAGDRIIVALAGPLFNILFGLVLGVFIWQLGVIGPAPAESFTVGDVPATYIDADGVEHPNPEYESGLRAGDRIVAVNGTGFTRGWNEAMMKIVLSQNGIVSLDAIRDDERKTFVYRMAPNPEHEDLGVPFMRPLLPTQVRRVTPDTPADRAGLQDGDVLLEINDKPVINPSMLIAEIQSAARSPMRLRVHRGQSDIVISDIIAEYTTVNNKAAYRLGIEIGELLPPGILHYPTPWAQVADVFSQTYRMLRALFSRGNPIGPGNLSGPVGIVHILTKVVLQDGYMAALNLIIVVSVSLAIVNLMPLPILDGGHITFAVVELLARRRLPSRIVTPLSYAFAVCLISLMVYITWRDAVRLNNDRPRKIEHQQPTPQVVPGETPAENVEPTSSPE